MTSWRSSRFLPETRSCSPWVWEETPLRPRSLMNLLSRLAWSDEMPARMAIVLAGRALLGLLDLAGLEGLQRDLALDQLLVEHLVERPQAVLGGGAQHELVVAELDGRVGVLEVEAGGRLPVGLVDRVADLLHVDFRDDVKRGHGVSVPAPPAGPGWRAGLISPAAGRCPSGQRKQAVNLPVDTYGGSNPSRPTHDSRRSRRAGCAWPLATRGCRYNAVSDRLRAPAPQRGPTSLRVLAPGTTSETD